MASKSQAASATLQEILLVNAPRPQLIISCERLIEGEVAAKSGFTGLAVKAAFKVVKKVKPGIISTAIDRLLNDFVEQVAPFYGDFIELITEPITEPINDAKGISWRQFLTERSSAVANALLSITDGRIERTSNRAIKKAYQKLRPSAVKHVSDAVPAMAELIKGYL